MAEPQSPTQEDLLAVAAYVDLFDSKGFSPGTWVQSEDGEDGWWKTSDEVVRWEQALYDHRIVDPDSDYLSERNVALVNQAIRDPGVLATRDLPTIRTLLTFLTRAERQAGGGWYEVAFTCGLAQEATRRLGELAG